MVYKWYILPIGGLYATYHILGEPETTIEILPLQKSRTVDFCKKKTFEGQIWRNKNNEKTMNKGPLWWFGLERDEILYNKDPYYTNLEPETPTLKWLFQLDDSNFFHEKWLFHQTSTTKWLFGVPGTNQDGRMEGDNIFFFHRSIGRMELGCAYRDELK